MSERRQEVFEPPAPPAKPSDRHAQIPLRLSECGDVLTVDQLCRVLQISPRHYFALRAHGTFPIPRLSLPGPVRYAKVAVERFLSSGQVLTPFKRKVG